MLMYIHKLKFFYKFILDKSICVYIFLLYTYEHIYFQHFKTFLKPHMNENYIQHFLSNGHTFTYICQQTCKWLRRLQTVHLLQDYLASTPQSLPVCSPLPRCQTKIKQKEIKEKLKNQRNKTFQNCKQCWGQRM